MSKEATDETIPRAYPLRAIGGLLAVVLVSVPLFLYLTRRAQREHERYDMERAMQHQARKYIPEITTLDLDAGKLDALPEHGYTLKGKVLPVCYSSGNPGSPHGELEEDLYRRLPDDLKASYGDEVGTLVVVRYGSGSTYQGTVNGAFTVRGIGGAMDLTIVDRTLHRPVGHKRFDERCSSTMMTVTAIHECQAEMPTKAIQFLASIPRG